MAAPKPIDLSLADKPKAFWKVVMTDYFGRYDKAAKCWQARIDGERFCMRPHRFDSVYRRDLQTLFVVVGGQSSTRTEPDDQPRDGGVRGV